MKEHAPQGSLFDDPAGPPVRVADVAVAAPIATPLSYAIADGVTLEPGTRVKVPLGPRVVEGFVLGIRTAPAQEGPFRPIAEYDDGPPILTSVTLELGTRLARRYGAAPGESFQTVVPAPVRAGQKSPTRRFVRRHADADATQAFLRSLEGKPSKEKQRRILTALLARPEPFVPLSELLAAADSGPSPVETLAKAGMLVVEDRHDDEPVGPRTEAPVPTPEQAAAVDAIVAEAAARRSATFVLDGITGSGKTEVYVAAAERTLALGRTVIMLVPEIALTPQTVERFRARLGRVAVLHSNQADGARARQWETLRTGEVRVALGPRSALFAPLPDVGLIVLDEEHEGTFKQQNHPRYVARDVAKMRADIEGAALVLGSATPSLEAEAMVRDGRARRLRLTVRATGAALPTVRVIDMRNEKPVGKGGLFSTALYHRTRKTLEEGRQVLLFLNRRGFSTQVLCKRCGWRARCTACDVNLTYYQGTSSLICHYCDARSEPPSKCPDCAAPDVRYNGAGTEKVAEAAMMLFPGKRVRRMDGETLRARGAAESIYADLKAGVIDILVGTQVIAKGLDIPNITLIGVINADTSLLIPDFRAAERTFQLLCQVAGRAGRGDFAGEVLIQTFEPAHYAMKFAAKQDAPGFADVELPMRAAHGYPPSGHLVRIVTQAPDADAAREAAQTLRTQLDALTGANDGRIALLGPAPCPIPLLQGAHRFHLLARARVDADLDAVIAACPERTMRGGVRVIVDRDPSSMM
ncbi:MAG: hypothetical protein RIS21_1285 [Planctomycetota bacterium]